MIDLFEFEVRKHRGDSISESEWNGFIVDFTRAKITFFGEAAGTSYVMKGLQYRAAANNKFELQRLCANL
jgi:hypothetical protein